MELYYKAYGDGYPLIILHGLFGSLENWQTLSRAWARCYHVFAIDQRNHGHSPHHPIMNYAVMAEDPRIHADASISSAYLLGHSMGGKTNITTRVRFNLKLNPNRFFCAHYRHAGRLSQTSTDADVTQRKAASSKGGS